MKQQLFRVLFLISMFWLYQGPVAALPYEIVQDQTSTADALQIDGNQALTIRGHRVEVWDLETQRVKFKLNLAADTPFIALKKQTLYLEQKGQCVAQFHDASRLVSACSDQPGIQIWDRQTGRLIKHLKSQNHLDATFTEDCRANQFPIMQRAGRYWLRQEPQYSLKVWNTQTQQLQFSRPQETRILKIASSQQSVALLLLDQRIRVYRLGDGQLQYERPAPDVQILDLAFDQNQLAISDDSGQIKIVDANGQILFQHHLLSQPRQTPVYLPSFKSFACQFDAGIGIPDPQLEAEDLDRPFQQIYFSSPYIFGINEQGLSYLHTPTQTTASFDLPACYSHFRVQGDWFYGWEMDKDQNCKEAWAFDLKRPQIQSLPQVNDEFLSLPDGSQLPISSTRDRFSILTHWPEPAGQDIFLFNNTDVIDSEQRGGYIIQTGIDRFWEIWDPEQGTPIQHIVPPHPVQAVDFSEDTLVFGYRDPDIKNLLIYTGPNYQQGHLINGPQNTIRNLKLVNHKLWVETLDPNQQMEISVWPLPKSSGETDKQQTATELFPSPSYELFQKHFYAQESQPIPENIKSLSLPEPSILGWQITATGLQMVVQGKYQSELKTYLWNQDEPKQQVLSQGELTLVLLEPHQLIYEADHNLQHLDLKTGEYFTYTQSKTHADQHFQTHLIGPWLTRLYPNEDKSTVMVWPLQRPELLWSKVIDKQINYIHDLGNQLRLQWTETITQNHDTVIHSHYLNLDPLQSQQPALSDPSRCENLPGNWPQNWVNWKDSCYQLSKQHLVQQDPDGSEKEIALPNQQRYYPNLDALQQWLLIHNHQTQTGVMNLESGSLHWGNGPLELVRVSDSHLTLKTSQYSEPDRYLYLNQEKLGQLNTLTQFKTHFFTDGAIIIAPDGNYAGWGNYQQYLHFADDQNQMLPWPEAERRWHHKAEVQTAVTALMENKDEN